MLPYTIYIRVLLFFGVLLVELKLLLLNTLYEWIVASVCFSFSNLLEFPGLFIFS